MSEKGLKILAKESLISLCEGKFLNPYDYCLFVKHHRVSFCKLLKHKENKLELVHSDVSGPSEVGLLHHDGYFVTFIDDVPRKTWVYMLKAKIHAFQKFQQFHAMVEREASMPLKAFCMDNSREYTSNEFEE